MTSATAVNVVPVSSFAIADPLDGSELVPIVQDGLSKRTTAADIAGAHADVAEATVQGRTLGGGTGPVETLTEGQVSDIIWDDFSLSFARRNPNNNNVGYCNVPPFSVGSRALANNDCGQGIFVDTAVSRTYTLPSDLNAPDIAPGFSVTLAVIHAGGTIVIALDGGVTLVDFNDGTSGTKSITGIGIATVWKLKDNTWGVHGSAALG